MQGKYMSCIGKIGVVAFTKSNLVKLINTIKQIGITGFSINPLASCKIASWPLLSYTSISYLGLEDSKIEKKCINSQIIISNKNIKVKVTLYNVDKKLRDHKVNTSFLLDRYLPYITSLHMCNKFLIYMKIF